MVCWQPVVLWLRILHSRKLDCPTEILGRVGFPMLSDVMFFFCVYLCMYVRMYVCMYACMYVDEFICFFIYLFSVYKHAIIQKRSDAHQHRECLGSNLGFLWPTKRPTC